MFTLILQISVGLNIIIISYLFTGLLMYSFSLSQIDQEMKTIIGKDVKSAFIDEWQKYTPAIIEYARNEWEKGSLCENV